MDPYTYSPVYTERRRLREKEALRRVGFAAGLCVIAYVLIESGMSVLMAFVPFRTLWRENAAFFNAFVMVESAVAMLLPFGLAWRWLSRKNATEPIPFGKPKSASLAVTAVLFGSLICAAGDTATSWFVTAMDSVGITLTAPEFDTPTDLLGRAAYVAMIALMPPLVEEFAVRGVVMQSLRRYGDVFAIFASAFFFAILHGNLVQAPFAFIAGIGLGYAVCVTGSLWTSIVIHLLNNLYSVVLEFLVADIPDEARMERIYLILTVAIVTVSAVGSALHIYVCKKQTVQRSEDPSLLTAREKIKGFLLNVPMIIAMLILLWFTRQYVSFG